MHHPRRKVGAALVALVTALPLLAVTATPAEAAVSLRWRAKASGLTQPVQVTSARDGTGRLFIVEKPGRVRIYEDGAVRSRAYLDIRSRVRDAGEGGLLSIAFSPRWQRSPLFWVAYTNNAGDLRVARFRASSYRANHVAASRLRGVLTVPHPASTTNHFAGQLAFGPGGKLFLSTGDGGGSGDPGNQALNKSSLQGKILRLTVLDAGSTCGRRYCVPGSNPFAGSTPGHGLVWAYGLRNAWRFSVDHSSGDLWVADVGQDRQEEVNRIGRGGLNLGWSCREGRLVYNASRCRQGARYHGPAFAYGHGRGESVTGGFVYRGSRYRSMLGGHYIAGDFISGAIFMSRAGRLRTVGQLDNVTSFGEDGRRELWATTIGGGLYRMVARRT